MFGINNSGGTDRAASMLANSLYSLGHKVVLASLGSCDKPFFPINKNIKIISLVDSKSSKLGKISSYTMLKTNNLFLKTIKEIVQTPQIILQIRRLLHFYDIDTIISSDVGCVRYTIPAAVGLQVKSICWEHFGFNIEQGLIRFKLRQFAARYCDAVVTLTRKDKEYWLSNTKHKSQIYSIANACPFSIRETIEDKNEKIVLAVGNLTPIKGFDMLLEAWVKVANAMPDWKLKIVGEGEERSRLTDFINQNNISYNVELVGATHNISEYYREAEIFCLSSRFEGFGMVLIEALSFGLPIVSFNCEVGPSEVLENSGATLVPEQDIDLLAISLIELMQNKEKRNKMSWQSIEKAKDYQLENVMSKWVDLLENI